MLNIENSFKNYPDVVDIKQLQTMLRIGRNVAYQLVKENRIKNIRIGTQIKIAKQSVIDFANEGGTAA